MGSTAIVAHLWKVILLSLAWLLSVENPDCHFLSIWVKPDAYSFIIGEICT
jgi:hypothetical protein